MKILLSKLGLLNVSIAGMNHSPRTIGVASRLGNAGIHLLEMFLPVPTALPVFLLWMGAFLEPPFFFFCLKLSGELVELAKLLACCLAYDL